MATTCMEEKRKKETKKKPNQDKEILLPIFQILSHRHIQKKKRSQKLFFPLLPHASLEQN